MKRIFILNILIFFCLASFGQSPKELWTEANNNYSKANYEDALAGFKKIEESGYVSSALYYNMGNTYFKLKQIGKSILYYERALKLDPSDKDALNNLQLAREFTLDRIEEIPDFILNTWIKSINYSFSSDVWGYIALVLLAGVALFLLLFKYGPTLRVRKSSFFASMIFLLFFCISIYFSWSQKHVYNLKDTAIIIKPVSTIKSSPDNSGNTLFILHEGTKVSLLDEIGQWKKIELADGRQGWVSSLDIEVI